MDMDSEEVKFQEIQCIGSDDEMSHIVFGNDVVVKPSALPLLESSTSSNKVKVSQISKYDWKEKFYLGNLVSCNDTYISYVLQAKSVDDNDTVRVINQHTSERVLLKGFKKRVVDVSFESLKSNRLACVDSVGTLYVYKITSGKNTVESKLLVKISRGNSVTEVASRVVWAPNLLLPVESHDTILGISTGTGAIVYNLEIITKKYEESELDLQDINSGVIEIDNCHSKLITCLALSPDKRVLATSSMDGDVKFWSLNFNESEDSSEDCNTTSCLHEWEPHGGEPVTSLFFCDDLLIADDSSPFWRYLITGTSHNTVLKIWCAVKWECLQTIRFAELTGQEGKTSKFKVAIDITAKYLLLADIHKPVLYICQLHKDIEQEKASIFNISEFALKEPLLSFSIFVAKERKMKSSSLSGDNENGTHAMNGDCDESLGDVINDENLENMEGEESPKEKTSVVTLFAVNKMALQKLSIKFKGCPFPGLDSVPTNTTSQDDQLSIRDALSDVDASESMTEQVNMPSTVSSLLSDIIDVSVLESHQSTSTGQSITTPNDKPQASKFVELEEIEKRLVGHPPIFESLAAYENSQVELAKLPSQETENPDVSELVLGARKSVSPQPLDEKEKSVDDRFISISPSSDKLLNNLIKAPSPVLLPQLVDQSGLQNINEILCQQQSLIMAQQKELSEIKDLVKTLIRQQQPVAPPSPTVLQSSHMNNDVESDSVEDIKVHMQLLQKSAASQFSKASKEFSKQCTQKLEQLIKDIDLKVHEKEERTIQILSNIVNNTIAMKLEKTIKNEMKQTVLNGMEKIANKYYDNMNNQMAQKLSLWERTLREECSELVKSKPLAESIGYAAASILEGTIPNAYRESFQNVLLPGFEKASMAMFLQINQTFQQGTKQYLERLEQHLEAKKLNHEDSQSPLLNNLQDLVNSFQGTADRLTTGVETNLEALMQKQLRDATDRMQSTFGKTIESRIIPSLSKTISKCADESFDEWKKKIDGSINAMFQSMSQVQGDQSFSSANEITKKKTYIERMIENRNYNAAFEMALSASDLSLVLFACEQVEPTELFNPSGVNVTTLTQPIILSLIQQLSQNLLGDTEIKTRYLEESIFGLDTKEEITRTHLPGILQSLNEQLSLAIEHFQKEEPNNSKMIRSLKMLQMASKGIPSS